MDDLSNVCTIEDQLSGGTNKSPEYRTGNCNGTELFETAHSKWVILVLLLLLLLLLQGHTTRNRNCTRRFLVAICVP